MFSFGGEELTFPYNDDVPAEFALKCTLFGVTFFILFYFVFPVFGIAFRDYVVFAFFVSVPKASIYEYYGFVFFKYDVRTSWQTFVVYSVSVAM